LQNRYNSVQHFCRLVAAPQKRQGTPAMLRKINVLLSIVTIPGFVIVKRKPGGFIMGKIVDTAHEYTPDEIAAVMRRLDLARALFVEFLEEVEKQPTKTLAAHNSRTLERALANLDSTAAAISKSLYAARSGQPFAPGEHKPRSVARVAKTARVAEGSKPYKSPPKRRKPGHAS
jgi:hypothetical protein